MAIEDAILFLDKALEVNAGGLRLDTYLKQVRVALPCCMKVTGPRALHV